MSISLSISLALLWFLFAFCYRNYRLDYLREHLFGLRAELFELAATSDALNFDQSAYRILERRLNSTIRYAHHVRLVDLTLTLFALRNNADVDRAVESYEESWQAALESLSPKMRERLESISSRMRFEVMQQVMLTSLLVWLLVLPILTYFLLKAAAKQLVVALTNSAKTISMLDRFDVASKDSAMAA